MQIQNTNTTFISSALTARKKLASTEFEKVFESSLAKAKPQKTSSENSNCLPDQCRSKERTLKHLGTISSTHPTVSHLLISHSEYNGDCWEIIHSDLNQNKPYTRIPDGTDIYMDLKSKEIVWDYGSLDQTAITARNPKQIENFAPEMRKTVSNSLLKTYRLNNSLKNAATDFLPANQKSKNREQQLIDMHISRAAVRYNLPEALIRGVIKAESDFQVRAVSPAGAQGLMQLMPATARELGVTNPFDIRQNIEGGTRYLKQMLNTFNGDLKKALSAYNAGAQTVKNYQGNVPFLETRRYVQRVLAFLNIHQ